MRRKDFYDYSLYVFDLDGTLYDQPKLRMTMALRLMGYYILHPHLVKDLFILMHFRKVKDGWTEGASEEEIIKKVADDLHTDRKRAQSVIRKWIYEDPLNVLKKTRDDDLISLISTLRKRGSKVVVWSDYPTRDKLEALAVEVDASFGPDDERIDELKPSPKGLNVIMSTFGAKPSDVLMIGDRAEKDGAAAAAASVDYVILPRSISRRKTDEI